MKETAIKNVQESFDLVAPKADAVAELFYGRLFEIAPELRAMFGEDITEQGRKLIAMLATAVKGLSDLLSIVPAAQALGVRHKGYGVTEAHFAPVGEALLWTLGQGLGEAFSDEVRSAWAEAYELLSSVMIEAMASSEEAAA